MNLKTVKIETVYYYELEKLNIERYQKLNKKV